MWAILGNIEFEVVGSPEGMTHRFAGEYAEHALISRKPRLEAVHASLDEISLEIKLHYVLGDVEERLRQIRAAVAAMEPLAWVTGDGDYRGPWAITEGTVTATKSTAGGRLLSAQLSLTLREYAGEFKRPKATPGIVGRNSLPDALSTPAGPASAVQTALGHARTADNAIRSVNSLIRDAQSLTANPLVALQQLPGISRRAGDAMRSVLGMQAAADGISNLDGLAELGGMLASSTIGIRDALRAPQAATVFEQLERASGFVHGGVQALDEARPALTRLAARVATRQP